MGTYITAQSLYDVSGETNVRQWADYDADGDDTAIDARIDAEIAVAERHVLDRFRGSRYALPFVEEESGALSVVKRAMCQLAIYGLYAARGLRDDAIEDRMAAMRERAEETIDAYLAGQMKMAVALVTDQNDSPAVV